jgi:signal peptidase I
MKDLFGASLIALLFLAEGCLWVGNPMHIPAAFITARAFGLQLFQEPGDAMAPAVSAGRHVLVSSWAYWGREPRVGDIVAFRYPRDPSIPDLKRIVAAGGSTVEIRAGVVYVDDMPSIGTARLATTASSLHGFMPKLRVPQQSFFVLGDNPDGSEDSRNYGVINRGDIIGKRWL